MTNAPHEPTAPGRLLHWTPRAPITAAEVTGRHIGLRPFCPERDPEPLWNAFGGIDGINQHLQWFGWEPLANLAQFAAHLQDIEEEPGSAINVFIDPHGRAVGMASYLATNPQHGTTEIGYVAHGRTVLRTPATTEAHYLLAKRAFEEFGYRRYEWKCNADNLPSRRAALRMGFRYEGTFRNHRVARDRNRDTAWFSMTDADWPGCKAGFERWLAPDNFTDERSQARTLAECRADA
ncbi:MAG: GNAT family protein [Planctomycetota bacterium]